ncbi:hypothetical protein GM173_06995 [Deefgea chitinilytica]|uniref:Signal peptide prediction n=2 Tax=Chitinibacteraceae TaxID=2897177 RepID=A0ABS2CD80_9NEIS|nr:hypothetical protein [Deefgea chitinilytica]MBM9888558.1 hypothetical protein [Deefgea sp. CFH1-16]
MLHIRCWGIYLWAFPASACGLILALPLLLLGGKVNWVTGVLEVCAPRYCAQWVRHFGAITFGHVVIARDVEQMVALREHERVHVRQYARWGVLFFPLYIGSSCWQLLRGRRFYRDNCFEREAYGDARKAPLKR